MAQPTSKKVLLQRWTKWLFEQDPGDNAGDDQDGSIVERKNSGNIWLIPGTWGMTGVPTRTINVPAGAQLFIVVGSSHAIYDELRKDVTKNEANLKKLANEIDGFWGNNLFIEIDQVNCSPMIEKVETDAFNVTLPAGQPVYPNVSKRVPMVSVGRIFVAKFDQPGTHTIKIEAHSPAKKPSTGKEVQRKYDVEVRYTVNVQ